MRNGGDSRGSSRDRRRRRAFLVSKFGSKTGKTVECFWCPKRLRTSTPKHPTGTFEVDRFPKCGHAGGTYRRDNIVPACRSCNASRCKSTAKCRRGPSRREFGKRIAA